MIYPYAIILAALPIVALVILHQHNRTRRP
jgi:hypothetical protein